MKENGKRRCSPQMENVQAAAFLTQCLNRVLSRMCTRQRKHDLLWRSNESLFLFLSSRFLRLLAVLNFYLPFSIWPPFSYGRHQRQKPSIGSLSVPFNCCWNINASWRQFHSPWGAFSVKSSLYWHLSTCVSTNWTHLKGPRESRPKYLSKDALLLKLTGARFVGEALHLLVPCFSFFSCCPFWRRFTFVSP